MADAICSLIDHRQQYKTIRKTLSDTCHDRAVFWFEAGDEDWPEMLAKRLVLEHWKKHNRCKDSKAWTDYRKRFVPYENNGSNAGKVMDDWCEATPIKEIADRSEKLRAFRQWLNEAPLTVFYAVATTDFQICLAKYLRDVDQALADLGTLNPDVQVIVLIACTLDSESKKYLPALRRLFLRLFGRMPPEANKLPPIRPLKKADITAWHNEFPEKLREIYDHDQLKCEIFDQIFPPEVHQVRFHEVRKYMHKVDTLSRARKDR